MTAGWKLPSACGLSLPTEIRPEALAIRPVPRLTSPAGLISIEMFSRLPWACR